MARLLRRRVWPVLVVELLVILRLRHYALVQLLHGVDVDDVDVAIAEIALRAEVDREIEEIESVGDVPVYDSQKHFLREASRNARETKPPVGNVADHQGGARIPVEVVDVDGQQLRVRVRHLAISIIFFAHSSIRLPSLLGTHTIHCRGVLGRILRLSSRCRRVVAGERFSSRLLCQLRGGVYKGVGLGWDEFANSGVIPHGGCGMRNRLRFIHLYR